MSRDGLRLHWAETQARVLSSSETIFSCYLVIILLIFQRVLYEYKLGW